MENLSIIQVRDFAIVLIAIMGFVVLTGNVIKTIKGWREPGMSEAQWRTEVDNKLDTDNKRIASLEEGNKVICKALMAIMSHEINGNSIDKLQKAYDEMNDYLIDK